VWVPTHTEPLPRIRHTGCDRIVLPALACRTCARPVRLTQVVGGFGPSGSWERSVPAATTRRRSTGAPQSAQPPTAQPSTAQPGLFPQTMALVGNRHSAALLGAAYLGATHYSEFARRTGAPPTVVADRLRRLVDGRILRPRRRPDRPGRVTYHLTGKGLAFLPVVILAVDWGQRYFAAPEGPALVYRHGSCAALAPHLACDGCGAELAVADIRAEVPAPVLLKPAVRRP